MNRLKQIIEAIEGAEKKGPLEYLNDLQGYSGKKLIGALQRLSNVCLDENTVYLEIGVYRGLTLTSVAKTLEAKSTVVGIDNFAFFDKEGKNEKIIFDGLKKYHLEDKVQLINADYEDALENLEKYIGDKKVGVYFIDGPHDYRSQLMCLELARKHLATGAVILIDDSNYQHVRQANCDFLKSHPEYKLIFQSYTSSHPDNMKSTEEARNGWWDGINIIVHDPENQLDSNFPHTVRTRILFENEHTIQASKFGALAPYTHLMFIAFWTLQWKEMIRYWIMYRREKKRIYKHQQLKSGVHLTLNTYSEQLKTWIHPNVR